MIRLLVADDHVIFRQGLIRLLAEHSDLVVVSEAASSAEVIEAIRTHQVDMLILDLTMPGRSGIELIPQVKALRPGLKVLVLTMHGVEPYMSQALRAGADAYITKENAASDLMFAIRRVGAGGRYICSDVAEHLATGIATNFIGELSHKLLSQREHRIFEMLVSGKRGWEIANELSLSEKTVSTHKVNVLRKMNVTNLTELVRYAVRHQLVSV